MPSGSRGHVHVFGQSSRLWDLCELSCVRVLLHASELLCEGINESKFGAIEHS